MSKWIRYRFHANLDDSRPVIFPPPGPWWETGTGEDFAVVVAYLPPNANLLDYWPEASNIDPHEHTNKIVFTDRFPKPDWWEA